MMVNQLPPLPKGAVPVDTQLPPLPKGATVVDALPPLPRGATAIQSQSAPAPAVAADSTFPSGDNLAAGYTPAPSVPAMPPAKAKPTFVKPADAPMPSQLDAKQGLLNRLVSPEMEAARIASDQRLAEQSKVAQSQGALLADQERQKAEAAFAAAYPNPADATPSRTGIAQAAEIQQQARSNQLLGAARGQAAFEYAQDIEREINRPNEEYEREFLLPPGASPARKPFVPPKDAKEALARLEQLAPDNPVRLNIEQTARLLSNKPAAVDPSTLPLDRSTVGEAVTSLGRGGLNMMSPLEAGSRVVAQTLAPAGGEAQASEFVAQPMRDAQTALRPSTNLNTFEKVVVGGIESIPQLAAQVVAAAATGGSSLAFAGTAVLPVMSSSYNDTFDLVIQNGGSVQDANFTAMPKAIADGIVTGITSKAEFKWLQANPIAKASLSQFLINRAKGMIAEGGQEGVEQGFQELTEAAARYANDIAQKSPEEIASSIGMATASGGLVGSFMPRLPAGAEATPAIPPDVQARAEADRQKAAKLDAIAAQKASEGNPVAAQTVAAVAERMRQNAANAEQAALADIQAQQAAILDQFKAEAAGIDDRLAQAEAATQAAYEESLASQEAQVKEGDKQVKATEDARKRDIEARKRALQAEIDEAKVEQLRQKAEAEKAKASGIGSSKLSIPRNLSQGFTDEELASREADYDAMLQQSEAEQQEPVPYRSAGDVQRIMDTARSPENQELMAGVESVPRVEPPAPKAVDVGRVFSANSIKSVLARRAVAQDKVAFDERNRRITKMIDRIANADRVGVLQEPWFLSQHGAALDLFNRAIADESTDPDQLQPLADELERLVRNRSTKLSRKPTRPEEEPAPLSTLTVTPSPAVSTETEVAGVEGGPERIIAAAIRGVNGEVRTGITHGDVDTDGMDYVSAEENIGFLTSKGRYVTQGEAEAMTRGSSGSEEMAYFLKTPEGFNERVEQLESLDMTRPEAEAQAKAELAERELRETQGETEPTRPSGLQPIAGQEPSPTLPEGTVSSQGNAGVSDLAGLPTPAAEGGVAERSEAEATNGTAGEVSKRERILANIAKSKEFKVGQFVQSSTTGKGTIERIDERGNLWVRRADGKQSMGGAASAGFSMAERVAKPAETEQRKDLDVKKGDRIWFDFGPDAPYGRYGDVVVSEVRSMFGKKKIKLVDGTKWIDANDPRLSATKPQGQKEPSPPTPVSPSGKSDVVSESAGEGKQASKPSEPAPAVSKAEKVADTLDSMAEAAKARIKNRQLKGKGRNKGGSTLQQDITDAAIYVAGKVGAKGVRIVGKAIKLTQAAAKAVADFVADTPDLKGKTSDILRQVKYLLTESASGDTILAKDFKVASEKLMADAGIATDQDVTPDEEFEYEAPKTISIVAPEGEAESVTQATNTDDEGRFSARRKDVDEVREVLGLDEIPSPDRQEWADALQKAKDENLADTAKAKAQQIINKPIPMNVVETAGMVLATQRLRNKHAELIKQGNATENESTLAAISTELDDVESDLEMLTQALRLSGTEKGRALAAQKLTINKNFDLASLLVSVKIRKGSPLTESERQQIAELAKKNEELTKRSEALEMAERRSRAKNVVNEARTTRRERPSVDRELAEKSNKLRELMKAGCVRG